MARYKIVTLVDITRPNIDRSETDKIKIGQQANFNSLVQAIGLRANCDWSRDPVMSKSKLPEPLDGKANHWIWEFEVERDQLFEKDGDPVALLVADLNGVPIIPQLNNSIELNPAIFDTLSKNTNTWIYKI